MPTRRLVLAGTAALLALTALILAGCGDTIAMSDPASVDEEEMLREFVEEDGMFDDLGPYEAGFESSGGSGSRDVIDPLTFWRHVTDRDRTVDVDFDPETGIANVTVYREIWGVLHILGEDMVEYEKPFHHTGLRYATFLRDEDWEPPQGGSGSEGQGQQQGQDGEQGVRNRFRHGPWELTAISGFVGESDTLTVTMADITVESATVNVTITDPLELLAVPDEVLAFQVGEEVTVTVTGAPDDAILFLHTRHWKSPFAPQGGGVFVGTWTVERPGRHCAWVEALAHDSIYDTDHPEDTLVWGMPYVVEGDDLEEIE
ncbi:MAG: hypothetical protein ABIG03_02155 [Candidatus Eisenbacteria bacterium]